MTVDKGPVQEAYLEPETTCSDGGGLGQVAFRMSWAEFALSADPDF